MKNILAILLALIMLTPAFAKKQGQDKIDSLLAELPNAKEDTNKVKLLISISDYYMKSDKNKSLENIRMAISLSEKINSDKWIVKANRAMASVYEENFDFENAINLYNITLNLSKEKNTEDMIPIIFSDIGICFGRQNIYDSSEYYFDQALKNIEYNRDPKILGKIYNGLAIASSNRNQIQKSIEQYSEALEYFKKAQDSINMVRVISNIGISKYRQSKHAKALEYCLEGLSIAEKIDAPELIGNSNLYIGNIYIELNDISKALKHYKIGLKNFNKNNSTNGIAQCLNNLGAVYYYRGNMDSAKKYFMDALKLYEKTGAKTAMSHSLDNLAQIASDELEFEIADEYYKKSIEIAKEINDSRHIAYLYGNIASMYFKKSQDSIIKKLNDRGITNNLNKTLNNRKAIEYSNKAIDLSREIDNIEGISHNLRALSNYYIGIEDYQKALEAYKEHISLRDSISNEETLTKIANLEAKRENDLKAKEIEKLEKENEYQQSRSYYLYALSALIFFVLVVMFLFYRNKRKSNHWLAAKNKVIKEANIELETLNNDLADKNRQISLANTELEELNNDLAEKNHTISEAHLKITDSINYAEKIQKAMLPFPQRMNEIFKEHFVLYKPKDVVSGDFYWVDQAGGYTFVAVVDCTGHGVPGAFMSIIGYDLLNQIVLVDKIFEPRDILTRLNELVRKALHQKDEIGSQQDGMELSIIRIKGDELVFAGARRPLWYSTNGKIEEIKGDKFGIGGRVRKERIFTQQTLELKSETRLFMFSDGILDQNNEKDEFFGKEKLKELLERDIDFNEKRIILSEELNKFSNGIPFRDDITVMGLKI